MDHHVDHRRRRRPADPASRVCCTPARALSSCPWVTRSSPTYATVLGRTAHPAGRGQQSDGGHTGGHAGRGATCGSRPLDLTAAHRSLSHRRTPHRCHFARRRPGDPTGQPACSPDPAPVAGPRRTARSPGSQSSSARSAARPTAARSWSVDPVISPPATRGHPEPHLQRLGQRPGAWLRGVGHHLATEGEADAQLLGDLAVQRGHGVLAALHLAARELPLPRELGWSGATGGEHPRRAYQVVDDRGGDDQPTWLRAGVSTARLSCRRSR